MLQSRVMNKVIKIVIALLVVALALFLARQIDINRLLETGSLLILALVLFAETGLLIGFFLPGDTLLFAAGFFAAQGRLNLGFTLFVLFLGTLIGNMVGYEIGKRSGPRIFKSDEALLFSKQNVEYAESFYKKHGGKTILIARFIPIVRTLAPLIAGIGKMKYRIFMLYNTIGAFLWVGLITMIGYWAGKVLGKFFNIDKYILPVVLMVTILTFAISFWHIWKEPKSREHIKKHLAIRYKALFKK
jgi:membrane-associated protein